jgi:ABC-type amino acid transport substrate-binding protein
MCLPVGWQIGDSELEAWVKNKDISIVSPKDISSCVSVLQKHQADFFITDALQGKILRRKFENTIVSNFVLNATHLYMIVSKKHPEAESMLQAFNAQLGLLKQSPEYQEIINSVLME